MPTRYGSVHVAHTLSRSQPPDVHSTGPMDLIIVRHAKPQASAESADPPLSEVGHRQAATAAQRLQHDGITHIVASTMQRAHQTAQATAEVIGLPVALRDDLREADEHTGSYTPPDEITADHEIAKRFAADPYSLFEDGYEKFSAKVVGAFDDIIASHRGATVAVFCHGMVMATYLDNLWGLGDPFKPHHDYTGIMRIRASSTGLRSVRCFNDTGHVIEPG